MNNMMLISVVLAILLPLVSCVVYTPTNGKLNATTFFNFVNTQVGLGQTYIQVTPGTYVVPYAAAVNWQTHVAFSGLTGITVNMTGVRLTMTDRKRGGIYIYGCTRFRLYGVSISWQVPCSFQGTIISIQTTSSNTLYNVTIHNGYDVTDLNAAVAGGLQPTGYIFDASSRWWKAGNWDMYASKTQFMGGRTYQITFGGGLGPANMNVEVGDYMAFRGIGGNTGIYNGGGNSNVIQGTTLYDAGGFGYFDDGGAGANTYNSISIRRGPIPSGATIAPLLSTCADGLHSASARHGPTITNAYFEGMPDDGIAIHGRYSLVMSASGQYLNVTNNGFVAGDTLRLYDKNFNIVADYTLVSVTALPSTYAPPKTTSATEPRFDLTQKGIYSTLQLSSAVNSQTTFDWLIADPFSEGIGYNLIGNTIYNHRARGMLLKASNGVVSGNTIDGSTMAGMAIFPELYWNEADYSRNLLIQNNVIKNVAYHIAPVGGLIVSAVDPNNQAPTGYGHRNISIIGNTIQNVNYTNLVVNSANQIVIKNNQIIGPLKKAAVVDNNIFPGTAVVYIEDAQISISGNCLKSVGPAAASPPATFGPSVSSNVPAATGFALC